MNVVMFDPTESIEHKCGSTLQALMSAAGAYYELSFKPDARDIMIQDLGHLSEVRLALQLVWDRVRARAEAAE